MVDICMFLCPCIKLLVNRECLATSVVDAGRNKSSHVTVTGCGETSTDLRPSNDASERRTRERETQRAKPSVNKRLGQVVTAPPSQRKSNYNPIFSTTGYACGFTT